MAPRLPGGVGARGNAKARFFHPSAPIRAKWSNTYESQRLVDVVIVGNALAASAVMHQSRRSRSCLARRRVGCVWIDASRMTAVRRVLVAVAGRYGEGAR